MLNVNEQNRCYNPLIPHVITLICARCAFISFVLLWKICNYGLFHSSVSIFGPNTLLYLLKLFSKIIILQRCFPQKGFAINFVFDTLIFCDLSVSNYFKGTFQNRIKVLLGRFKVGVNIFLIQSFSRWNISDESKISLLQYPYSFSNFGVVYIISIPLLKWYKCHRRRHKN